MTSCAVTIVNPLGLHARAAAKFVQTASRFQSEIKIRKNGEEVDGKSILGETWFLFALIMIFYTAVNIFADRFLALMNNVSVGWHVLGVAVVIGLLVFVPDDHQSFSFVFGERINNSGLHDGSTSNLGFWLLVLPIGFLLTMYTQTGYDASAHVADWRECSTAHVSA